MTEPTPRGFEIFHVGDVLSVTTGVLVAPSLLDGVHRLLDYMTGDVLMTHQLPRACDACAPHLLDQHPQLAEVIIPTFDELEDGNREQAREVVIEGFLTDLCRRLGYDEVPVEPLPPGAWEHRNPIVEAYEMVGKDRVVVVVADDEQ